MYKLFNRVSQGSKEREPPSTAPSTFEEKFRLFNRGSSSSRGSQEKEGASPVEEAKFRLFGRSSSSSRTGQEREPVLAGANPPLEDRLWHQGRSSAASRLASHDREAPPASQAVVMDDGKPRTPPVRSPLPDEEPEQPQILLPCPTCFRTFRVESLDRHKGVCEKVATKKRKVFDSAKQRLEDLPEVATVPHRTTPVSPATLRRPGFASPVKKRPTWKENHLSLIRTVKEARASDMSRCPYCERNFNNKAYDRHVDWCKEQQSRIPKSPTHDTNEAKERWEARTKYRAPALRRSIRSKYSPTRSLFGGAGSPAASVDRLAECSKSLGGSRTSLDSRASSSAMSYQPTSGSSYARSLLGASRTLGRSSGSPFARQSHERRSLRAAPASPPPLRRSLEPPTPVPLTPINNNRTSALRASLRMKSAFSNLNSPHQAPTTTATLKTPVVSRYAQQNLSTPISTTSQQQQQQRQQRPTVLQLFSSAFGRQNGNLPNSPVSKAGHQGRRSEPEGVESKLMTASCYGNYPSPTSPGASAGKLKPPTRYSSSDSYNPYASAEQQLAELFDDDFSGGEKKRFSFSPKEAPSSAAPKSVEAAPKDDGTSMEQLERDLKSILSEINQLGKDKEKESTPDPVVAKSSATPSRLGTRQPTKVSTLSFTMSVPRTPSTPRTPSSPVSPTTPVTPVTPAGDDKRLPRFCHSCGSAYPERFQVKFCCQCGARRLYI